MAHPFVEYKETSFRTFQDKPLSIDRNFLNPCRIIAKLSPHQDAVWRKRFDNISRGKPNATASVPASASQPSEHGQFFPSIVTCEAAALLSSSVLQNNPEHVVRRFVLVALLLLLFVAFSGGRAVTGVQTLRTVVLGYRRPAAFPVCTAALEFWQNFAWKGRADELWSFWGTNFKHF